MTTIHVPMIQHSMYTVESYEDGRRYRWTIKTYIKPDGDKHIHTDCVEVPDEGLLTFIPAGADVDDIATRDLLQMAKEKPRPKREKPDIAAMWAQFRERRGRELDSKTTHPIGEKPW